MGRFLDDFNAGNAAIAFAGSRDDVWHRSGHEHMEGKSTAEWKAAADFNFTAIKVPAIADLRGAEFAHLDPAKRLLQVPNRFFMARDDNGKPLGRTAVSEQYIPWQPSEMVDWFESFCSVDSRFAFDVMGHYNGGGNIWMTATFNEPLTIGGDAHKARLLASTSFNTTEASKACATVKRGVCDNTVSNAFFDSGAVITIPHRTKVDPVVVSKQLATVAQSIYKYRAMGDAMVQVALTREETSNYFKAVLEIPFDAKESDISTRKFNQFKSLQAAYKTTVRNEGATPNTTWAAWQSVTRYIDHDRTNGDAEKVLVTTQFGSGLNLKAKAWDLLLPVFKDKVLLPV